MKLLYSPASPFVRKVLVVASERGLSERIEIAPVVTTPIATDAQIPGHNPIGKVPTLVLDDATSLFDSRVIVEHLDAIGTQGPRMIPDERRIEVLTTQALADGLTDALVLLRYETWLRPEDKRWPEWIAGQWTKVDRAMASLETRVPTTFDLGAIAIACALGYYDFRFADRNWRASHPKLAAWNEAAVQRESLAATKPHV